MEDKSLIFFGTLGLFTFNLLVVLFSIIGFNAVGLYMLFFTIPFGIGALYFDYLVARYFIQKFKQKKQAKAAKQNVLGASQPQQSKFWDFVEKLFEPVGWLFDKIESICPAAYMAPFFTLIGYGVVIYTIYFILATPGIAWWWIFPLLLITVPVLYFFTIGSIDVIKEWLRRRKEKKGD